MTERGTGEGYRLPLTPYRQRHRRTPRSDGEDLAEPRPDTPPETEAEVEAGGIFDVYDVISAEQEWSQGHESRRRRDANKARTAIDDYGRDNTPVSKMHGDEMHAHPHLVGVAQSGVELRRDLHVVEAPASTHGPEATTGPAIERLVTAVLQG